jgi:hypothetical protein
MHLAPIPSTRGPFALAFGDSAVSLMQHAPGGWRMVDRVALDDTEFTSKTQAMARHLGGRRQVTLWLPPGHVLSLRLSADEARDIGASIAARTGLDPTSLTTATLSRSASGDRIVFAADKTTLGESIEFARSWGFEPVSATVRPDSLPDGAPPCFSHPGLPGAPSRRKMARIAGAVAAVVVAAVMVTSTEAPSPQEPGLEPAAMSEPRALSAVMTGSYRPSAMAPSPVPVQAVALQAPTAPKDRVVIRPEQPVPVTGHRDTLPLHQQPPLHLAAIGPGHHADTEPVPPFQAAALTARSAPAMPEASGDPAPLRPAVADTAPEIRDTDAPPDPAGNASAGESAGEPAQTDAGGEVLAAAVSVPAEPRPSGQSAAPSLTPTSAMSPADAARAAVLEAIKPVPRPEVPLVVALRAPPPTARPRGIAVAARAQRDAAAARAAAGRAAAASTATVRGTTTAEVSRVATVQRGLPQGETGLIGVFVNGNDRAALLVLPDGLVTRVRRGDRVEGWTVSAIDETTVRLTGGSGARTLQVPQR